MIAVHLRIAPTKQKSPSFCFCLFAGFLHVSWYLQSAQNKKLIGIIAYGDLIKSLDCRFFPGTLIVLGNVIPELNWCKGHYNLQVRWL